MFCSHCELYQWQVVINSTDKTSHAVICQYVLGPWFIISLTWWSRVIFKELIVTQLVKNSHLLWNPKVHCCVHKSLPLAPILSHIHPVYTFWPYFAKVYSDIIIPCMPSLPSGFFPLGFPTKLLYACLISPMHATFPVHLILLYLITGIIFCEVYKLWSSSLPSLLQPPSVSQV